MNAMPRAGQGDGPISTGEGDTATPRHVTLQLDEMTKTYRNGVTVGPISFSARGGEFISLLGPSGCGKTTILRSIAGFEAIDQGSIMLRGEPVSHLPPHRRNVGLVFQNYSLFPHLTVFENVAFGLRLRRRPADEITRRVSAALASVGLTKLEDRRPSQISGGQQQRVAVARSIVLEPEILLLDEPLSNLDLKLRVQLRQELRAIQRRLGTTFVYVTHDQTEALALSDWIVVLNHGCIEQIGTPEEIYRRPRSRFVADFIGTSNLIEAEVVGSRGNQTFVRVGQGAPFPAATAGQAEPGGIVLVCIRPEDLRIMKPGGEEPSHFSGRVTDMVFSGDRREIAVAIDAKASSSRATAVELRTYTADTFTPGSPVALALDAKATAVIVEE